MTDHDDDAIDEVAAQAALRRLDAVAAKHPELCGPRGPDNVEAWAEVVADDEGGQAMASEPTTQVAFRFPDTLVERLDRHVERMKAATPGIDFSRADAVRSLLTRALDEVEGVDKARKGRR